MPKQNRNQILLRVLLLVALLATFAVFKQYADPGDRTQIDGFYYMHIAQNVIDGEGFVSRTSLYHQGFSYFPHPVNQPPVWILVLAGAASWLGMGTASKHLPEFFYLVDLLLLYLLANRLRARVGDPSTGWLRPDSLPNLGHVAVFLMGANPIFFRFTSLPYTEALGFTFLLGAFLALDRVALGGSRRWAAAAGLLTGLALLTRLHFLPAMLVMPTALVLCRERRSLGLAAFTGAFLVPYVPWILWLSTWLDPVTPAAALGLATLRETTELRVFPHSVATASLWEYLVDRSWGIVVAFNPWNKYSYLNQWGPAAWLVLVTPLWWGVRTGRRLFHSLGGIEARHVLPFAMVVCAVGMLIPVHMLHSSMFKDWWFGHRHGLPLILLMLPCIAWLDTAGRAARLVGAALIAASVLWLSQGLDHALTHRYRAANPNELKVAAWLDRQEGHPVVISSRAQRMATLSRRAYFHWMACEDTVDQTLMLLRTKIADYVMLYSFDRGDRCNFASITQRMRDMKLVHQFGKGKRNIRIFKLRNKNPPTSIPIR